MLHCVFELTAQVDGECSISAWHVCLRLDVQLMTYTHHDTDCSVCCTQPFDLLKEEPSGLLQPDADWFSGGTSIKLQAPPSSCMMLLPPPPPQQHDASAHTSPPSSACTHVLQWGSSVQQPVTSHGTVATAAGTAFSAPERASRATGVRVTLEVRTSLPTAL
jgi:hypothetical protein